MTIVNYALPSRLYKYRSFSSVNFHSMENREIYFSSYSKMNDPMEGFYRRSERGPEYFREAASLISHKKLDVGICSLSEDRKIDLMWAHYADNFAGFCIAYDFRKLVSIDGVEATRVAYRRNRPVFFAEDADDLRAATRKILSYKKDCWSYEKEWRLFREGTGVVDVGDVITRVYIGPRAKESEKKKLLNICSKLEIETEEILIDGYSLDTPSRG